MTALALLPPLLSTSMYCQDNTSPTSPAPAPTLHEYVLSTAPSSPATYAPPPPHICCSSFACWLLLHFLLSSSPTFFAISCSSYTFCYLLLLLLLCYLLLNPSPAICCSSFFTQPLFLLSPCLSRAFSLSLTPFSIIYLSISHSLLPPRSLLLKYFN
jgi:hypothetical protein